MQTVLDRKVTHQEYLALPETIHSTYFMLVKIASRRVASICFGYRGLTSLALMWFVPTLPQRSAVVKGVYRLRAPFVARN